MAVCAFRPEGDHDMRLYSANVPGDRRNGFGRIDAVERAVRIIEYVDFPQSELARRRPQLRLANTADDVRSRRFAEGTEAAALAPRRRHEIRCDTFGRALR